MHFRLQSIQLDVTKLMTKLMEIENWRVRTPHRQIRLNLTNVEIQMWHNNHSCLCSDPHPNKRQNFLHHQTQCNPVTSPWNTCCYDTMDTSDWEKTIYNLTCIFNSSFEFIKPSRSHSMQTTQQWYHYHSIYPLRRELLLSPTHQRLPLRQLFFSTGLTKPVGGKWHLWDLSLPTVQHWHPAPFRLM